MPIFSAISKVYRRIPVSVGLMRCMISFLRSTPLLMEPRNQRVLSHRLRSRSFKDDFVLILDNGKAENPSSPLPVQGGRRSRKRRTPAENLIDRCQRYRVEILRFMTDFRVPFTNNLAERDIRMVKVQQKISGTFRSVEGASNFCRVRGYISTARKNGGSVITAIRRAFEGEPFIPTAALQVYLTCYPGYSYILKGISHCYDRTLTRHAGARLHPPGC